MASLLSSSVPFGSLFGIPVKLHVLLPAVLVFTILSNLSLSWALLAFVALLYGPILWITVLLHELGHCLATRKLGAEVHGILLWPLGGLAFVGHSVSPRDDIIVAVAGPATHVPQVLAAQIGVWSLLLLAATRWSYGSFGAISLSIPDPGAHFAVAVCAGAITLNLWLMAFNLLLPAYPLDGGRILADVLLLAGLETVLAAKITAGAATVIGAGIVLWGLWPPTVLLNAAVGAWMLYSTWSLVAAIREERVEQHPMFCYEATDELTQEMFPKDQYQPSGGV